MNQSKTIIPFGYKGSRVRVIQDNKGEPWWVAKDVANILGYRDGYTASRCLDGDERLSTRIVCEVAGMANHNIPATLISESGLYKLILRSRVPQAKDFQRWVTHEVLPRIRKTGGYIMGEEHVESVWSIRE